MIFIFFVGICVETSNTTFICQCASGWEGVQCERMINYCENVSCLNDGVCQSSLLSSICLCVSDYSGEYCEITSNEISVHKTVARSFAYVVIIAMICVAIFITTLDVLKYCFGIDVVKSKCKKSESKTTKSKRKKKRKRPVSIIRYIYVNQLTQQSSERTILTTEETKV